MIPALIMMTLIGIVAWTDAPVTRGPDSITGRQYMKAVTTVRDHFDETNPEYCVEGDIDSHCVDVHVLIDFCTDDSGYTAQFSELTDACRIIKGE
jgi:hypothetical protein